MPFRHSRMDRFPLLFLPYTTQIEVFSNMSVIDLFTFSHISKRSYNLVPLSKSKNFSVKICYGRPMSIEIANTTFQLLEQDQWIRRHDQIDFISRHLKTNVSIHELDNKLFMFWSDRAQGMMAMGMYLLDLFKSKVECFGYCDVQGAMDFIKEVIKRQQQIKELRMYGDVPDEDITWIMDNLKVTDKLSISRHGQNFPYKFQQLPCKLVIYDASWFNLENLLHLGTCKLLRLSGSHLTNADIAQFIDHWKSGELPELEYFQMDYMQRMSENLPIGELAVFTAFTGSRDKEVNGETVSIFNGIEIDGNDGRTKALLSFPRDTQKFQFFVCRDTDFVRGRVI